MRTVIFMLVLFFPTLAFPQSLTRQGIYSASSVSCQDNTCLTWVIGTVAAPSDFSVLPVKLLRFDAQVAEKSINLNWSTAMETQSDRFEVQRSTAGKDWEKIGEVNSVGESSQLLYYSFVDTAPVYGQNIYRLKIIDNDQTFAFSRLVAVQWGSSGMQDLVELYPNPVSDNLSVKNLQWNKATSIDIIDVSAKSVYSVLPMQQVIPVGQLSSGTYLLRVRWRDGAASMFRFVVSR